MYISFRKLISVLVIVLCFGNFFAQKKSSYAYVQGQDIILNGQKFNIKGTNVGNWLNPEGYMFFFEGTSSYRLINEAFSELVGPQYTAEFWRKFQENYITKEDISYIKSTGMNTVRVPFHYKMFTGEDYMGYNDDQRGFEVLDKIIQWCKEENLYVILDMHDAPGGQTGDNIDDSYGYPWLMVNKKDQEQFIEIWKKIAKKYKNEKIILAYDLLNEPIAHYFKDDLPKLNAALEPLFIRATKEIRKHDKNHIVMLAGAQWNSNFSVFKDWKFDDNIMYTCHRYWSGTDKNAIQDFLDFREKTNLPLFMGETGENTDEWVEKFRITLEENNIGWTFWPYKKMVPKSGMMVIPKPKDWDLIVEYTKADRSNFEKIRNARPDQQKVRAALEELLENMKFKNNTKNNGYTSALGMKP